MYSLDLLENSMEWPRDAQKGECFFKFADHNQSKLYRPDARVHREYSDITCNCKTFQMLLFSYAIVDFFSKIKGQSDRHVLALQKRFSHKISISRACPLVPFTKYPFLKLVCLFLSQNIHF